MRNAESRQTGVGRASEAMPKPSKEGYVLSVGFRESGFQTVVARASRPCVGCTIRTGGTPVPLTAGACQGEGERAGEKSHYRPAFGKERGHG
jgi:hypothetical protein